MVFYFQVQSYIRSLVQNSCKQMCYGRVGEEFMASHSVFCSSPWNTSKETRTPVWRQVIHNYLMFTVKTAMEITCSYNFPGPKYYFNVVWYRILNEVCVCVHVFMFIDKVVVITNHVGFWGKNSCPQQTTYTPTDSVWN